MGCRSPRGRCNFRGLSVPFKSIGNLHCSGRSNVAEAFTAKKIIQSPITSCSRRDHSVCPASTKYSENCLGPVDAAYRREEDCGIAQRGWSVISMIALLHNVMYSILNVADWTPMRTCWLWTLPIHQIPKVSFKSSENDPCKHAK